MKRLVVAVAAAATVATAGSSALAQSEPPEALVFLIEGTTFERFVNRPAVPAAVDFGGIAMLRGPDPALEAIAAMEVSGVAVTKVPRRGDPELSIASDMAGAAAGLDRELLVIVVGLAPKEGVAAEGPDAVLVARGRPGELAGIHNDVPMSTLTSDSTRRHGVVTPADLVATVEEAIGREVPGFDEGSLISVVSVEPPVDLYEKYLRYRELSAPVQALVGVWELVVGGLAVWALTRRRSLCRLALGAALSLPLLFLSLLLVGHLPSLSYTTILPVLAVVTLVAGVALMRVADRAGPGVALAWAGGIGLGGLVVESLLGWTAAFAPMLGGSHLDGARFFGMPNVEIGLALGGATLVAAGLRSTLAGSALLFVTGLWAGSPWLASNLGASVTLFAGAGLWWGIRGRRGWLRTCLATVGAVAVGAGFVVFAHRFLTDAPTHITRFSEASGGLDGILDKAVDRLEIGFRLLRDQPPALIPVLGTPLALLVVLKRPPEALRAGFTLEPSARPAALTILLGSIVAYLANDTGAAALGLGFGAAMVTLFAVSLAARTGKMDP